MAKKLPKKVQEILAEAKGKLSALYAHRLKGMILFGSYARGDYTKGSDIDLLMLLEGLDDPATERERYFNAICDLSLKYDTVVTVIPIDYKTYHSRKTPLILNARKKGVRI